MLITLLSACQAPTPAGPRALPEPGPAETGDAGQFLSCYKLDSSASELRLLVYKTGPLARVGHNHVMVSHDLSGALARNEPFQTSRASVTLPVASLTVDPLTPRREEGADFASDVSDEARAGTRKNMLGADVLDAATYPEVQVDLLSLTGPRWSADAGVRIRVRDTVREQTVPIMLQEDAAGLTVISSFSFLQTDFGITPFSVLGGGLRVADEVRIRVKLRFVASAADGSSCLGSRKPDMAEPTAATQLN